MIHAKIIPVLGLCCMAYQQDIGRFFRAGLYPLSLFAFLKWGSA